MIACTSLRSTSRSTPLTISVPSSSATCRFSSFSSPTKRSPFPGKVRDFSRTKSLPSLAEESRATAALNGSCNRGRADDRGADEPAAQAQRRPGRARARLRVEAAVCTRVPGERLEEIVGRIERLVLLRVLALPAHAQEHRVAGARRELLTPHQLLRAPADRQLADGLLATVQHGLR